MAHGDVLDGKTRFAKMPADIGLDRPPPRHAYTATVAWRWTAIRFGFERSHHQITEMGGGTVAEALGPGLLSGLQQEYLAHAQVQQALLQADVFTAKDIGHGNAHTVTLV